MGLEQEEQVLQALAAYGQGLDFAAAATQDHHHLVDIAAGGTQSGGTWECLKDASVSIFMKLFKHVLVASALVCVSSSAVHAVNLIINGGFETPTLPLTAGATYCFSLPCSEYVPPSSAPPWQPTPGPLEYWTSGFLGIPAYEGNQYLEANNLNPPNPLFQYLTGVAAGTPLNYSFAHRGRDGDEPIQLKITDNLTSSVLFDKNFTSAAGAWTLYAASTPIFATGNTLKFEFNPIFPTGGTGNLIDAVQLNTPAVPAPLPPDGAWRDGWIQSSAASQNQNSGLLTLSSPASELMAKTSVVQACLGIFVCRPGTPAYDRSSSSPPAPGRCRQ